MKKISIVLVCKNEVDIIGRSLESFQGITDDILVYDSGSTDGTQALAKSFNVNLHEGSWEGFGITKNKAANLAKYDWILSIDADEAIDEGLKNSLSAFDPESENDVFDIRRKNFLGDTQLKYGEWGFDSRIRLFNRKLIQWEEEMIHERLVIPEGIQVKKLTGFILHFAMKDLAEYSSKMQSYAIINADKYFQKGKKATWIKLRLSPAFGFIKHYIFKGGFLDGHLGYISAKMTAYYTFLKYARLKELYKKSN